MFHLKWVETFHHNTVVQIGTNSIKTMFMHEFKRRKQTFHSAVSTAASVQKGYEESATRFLFTRGFDAIMSNISNSYYILSGFSLIFVLQQHNSFVLISSINVLAAVVSRNVTVVKLTEGDVRWTVISTLRAINNSFNCWIKSNTEINLRPKR